MTVKLHIVTHFDTIFLVIQFFLYTQTFEIFQNCKVAIYEYGASGGCIYQIKMPQLCFVPEPSIMLYKVV